MTSPSTHQQGISQPKCKFADLFQI
jgi:hypothetical protein